MSVHAFKHRFRKLRLFFYKRKYELLLFGLIQHLYIGIFLIDLKWYAQVIWPVNMLILGWTSVGIFNEKGRWKRNARVILMSLVVILPISLPFLNHISYFMDALSIIYVLFFAFIFYEVMRFLLRPSYINSDIILAAACGYFLLIEMCVFLMQLMYYQDPTSLNNVSNAGPAATYIDLVYFASVVQSTIGFGDITPNAHHTKLAVSFFGVVGQFYSVVLVGILISKFAAASGKKD